MNGKGQALKYAVILAAITVGVALFVGGVIFGFWFAQNFRIVPRGDFEKMIADALHGNSDLGKVLGKPGSDSSDALNQLLAQALKQQAAAEMYSGSAVRPGVQRNASQGAFTFKFTPGEKLRYTMSAHVKGEGLEAVLPEPVTLNMDSAFNLETQSVDPTGNAVLRMAFEGMRMNGNFMGNAMHMEQGPGGSRMTVGPPGPDGATARRETAMDMPILNYLNTPVKMRVDPNGSVQQLSGAPGMENMVDAMPLLTSIEFPSSEMAEGTQWESATNMPIPGFGTSVRTRIVNTFAGYKTIGRRLCAVIDQTISSDPSGVAPSSPGSALGAVVGFTMPRFDLNGKNTVYFDTNNGQVVHSEMDLGLHLDIGKALDNLGANLKGLLGDLPEFQGKKPLNPGKPPDNLLDLNVNINATVSLTDPIAP